MALKESEVIVLRTYPLRESDLLVTLFTRLEGKIHGVARAAKKSRRRFGGALEPLTLVRVYYEDRERRELARLDSCEVRESPLASEVSYPRAVALGLVAEVLPADKVLARAWEHAEVLTQRPTLLLRYTRLMFTEYLKKRMQDLLGYGLAMEGLALMEQPEQPK